MILKKYTGLDVGRALLLSDVVIAAAALFVFDITAGLCSLLGLALKSVLVDSAIESFNRRKAFFVISYDPEHVCDYITHTLGRGATVWQAQAPIPTRSTTWCSPSSPGDRPCFCAAT